MRTKSPDSFLSWPETAQHQEKGRTRWIKGARLFECLAPNGKELRQPDDISFGYESPVEDDHQQVRLGIVQVLDSDEEIVRSPLSCPTIQFREQTRKCGDRPFCMRIARHASLTLGCLAMALCYPETGEARTERALRPVLPSASR